MKSPSLFALGNAIIDAKYQVAESLLDEFGVKKGTMTLLDIDAFQSMYQRFNEQYQPHFASGGSAANSVATFCAMGGSGSFYCSLGNDDSARLYKQELTALGAQVHHATRNDLPTGHCLILVTEDGERTMCTYLGAASTIYYDGTITAAIGNADYAYFEAYLLTDEITKATLHTVVAYCRAQQTKVVFSFSDPNIVTFCANELDELLEIGIDMILCNKEEACLFTKQQDTTQAMQALQKWCPQVVITLGKEGALVGIDSKIHLVESNAQTQALDTTGAGDTFAGALLYALCCHCVDMHQALDYANTAAASVVTCLNSRLSHDQCQHFSRTTFG